MIKDKFRALMSGTNLKDRFVRSSFWQIFGYGSSQAIRLASNLILTRLLFPEAFGLMALVVVFLTGLSMFSDTGVSTAIQQNKRGDDPEFLDTAWTIQIIRGGILWLCTGLFAWPAAVFYGEPALAYLLPVAGLTLAIDGFRPASVYTAQRHLQVGRLTILNLIAQIVSILAMVVLAWTLRSVWALVIAMILGSAVRLLLMVRFLPGPANRLSLDSSTVRELLNFGKWIFPSTICSFLDIQGDRLILGKYLTTAMLGIYSIGYFLASFPLLLGISILGQILVPYFREKPPANSRKNFLALRKIRFLSTASLLALVFLLTAVGPYLVDFLYDSRYELAGPILTFVGVSTIPAIILLGYEKVSLAAGDSRSYFWMLAARTVIQTTFFLYGAATAGLIGALIGVGVARIVNYPVIARLAYRYGAWDPLHDAFFAILGIAGAVAVIYVNDLFPLVPALVN